MQFTTYAAIHVAMAIAWCSHDDAKVEGVSSLQEALSRHSTTLVIIAESEQVVHDNFCPCSPRTQIFGEYFFKLIRN